VTQRQFFLRPDAQVERIYQYCLAEAAARYQISLHGWVAMSNHQHVVFTDNLGNYPAFLAHLDKMIAKVMNARLGRWENFWAAEQPNVVHLVEARDRFDKLVYLLMNPVADDLVDRAVDWPGACSIHATVSGRSKTVARPAGFFREDGPMPAEVELRAARLPGFEDMSDEQWRATVIEAVRAAEATHRARRVAEGKTVLGRKAILAASLEERPKTVEPRRRLRPAVACKNEELRKAVLLALLQFRFAHREALRKLIARERGVVFPYGTYRVKLFGVRCAEAPCVGPPPARSSAV